MTIKIQYLLALILTGGAYAESLLVPAISFPGTIADLSRDEIRANKAKDYKKFKDLNNYQLYNIEIKDTKFDASQNNSTTQNAPQKNDADTPVNPNGRENNYTGETIGTGTLVFANNVFNGPCTPVDKTSESIHADIITTGRYETKSPAFEKTMINLFRLRRGCGNDSGDAGGVTCCGIAQNSHPDLDVQNLTIGKTEDIYWNNYYIRYGFNKLPDAAITAILPFASSVGGGTAIKETRVAFKLPETCQNGHACIDDALINAMKNYSGNLHGFIMDVYEKHYRDNGNERFMEGWLKRIRYLRQNGCHTIPKNPIKRTKKYDADTKCSSFGWINIKTEESTK